MDNPPEFEKSLARSSYLMDNSTAVLLVGGEIAAILSTHPGVGHL